MAKKKTDIVAHHTIPLRLPRETFLAMHQAAEEEHRSTTGQIVHIVTGWLRQRQRTGRVRQQQPSSPQGHAAS